MPLAETCAIKQADGVATFNEGTYLRERFAEHECDWCFERADGHRAYLDRYGDPVVVCAADEKREERDAINAQRRRQMLGGLS